MLSERVSEPPKTQNTAQAALPTTISEGKEAKEVVDTKEAKQDSQPTASLPIRVTQYKYYLYEHMGGGEALAMATNKANRHMRLLPWGGG